MVPELQLRIESQPKIGTVFVLTQGETRRLGGGGQDDFRLADLRPECLELRFARFPEARAREAGVELEGQLLEAGIWYPLRSGKLLRVGDHALRVEVHGLSPSALARSLSTRRLIPQGKLSAPAGYEVEGQIGKGAFGAVYAARRLSDQRPVALKLLLQHPCEDTLIRFGREAEAAASLRHPNLVEALELDMRHDPPYLVMELIPGPNLGDLVQQGPLPVERARRLGAGLALALSFLAERELVHRDVKPDNVLVAAGDQPKLADFGLVKDLERHYTTLTQTGAAIGTLAYVAPEQLRDAKRVTPAADVYGLGATLFELFEGALPFRIKTAGDLARVLRDPAPPMRRAKVSEAAREVIAACLRKDPAERPHPAEVHRALT